MESKRRDFRRSRREAGEKQKTRLSIGMKEHRGALIFRIKPERSPKQIKNRQGKRKGKSPDFLI